MFLVQIEAWVDNELANPTEKDYRGKNSSASRTLRLILALGGEAHLIQVVLGTQLNPGCVGMEDGSKHRDNPFNMVEVRKVALK